MSHSPPIDENLAARAADWVARLAAEDAGEGDWLALEAWLAADPNHLQAYDKAERLAAEITDQAADILAEVDATTPSPGLGDLVARRTRRSPMRWVAPFGAVAAAAALAIVAGPALWPVATVTYQAAAGDTQRIALADGSEITLNGGSTITVRLGRGERHVEMDGAEASFDVAADASRPFTVAAGQTLVRVVGTEFNIDQQSGGTTVTVRRGVVEVRDAAGMAGAERLVAGRKLTHGAGASEFIIAETNPDADFAWRGGRLVYAGAPLSEVAADLSRRFPIPVRAEGAAATLTFSGVLVLDDPDAVIRRIQSFLPVEAHRSAEAITLSSR